MQFLRQGGLRRTYAVGWRLLLVLTAFSARIATCESDIDNEVKVVKLNKFNYKTHVETGAWFIKYYAPWCTHCLKMAPTWEKLAQTALDQEWAVRIAEVDCTTSKDICQNAAIKGFPTLKLLVGGAVAATYKGDATVARFEEWLNSQGVLRVEGGANLDEAATGRYVGWSILESFPTGNRILNVYIIGLCLITAIATLLRSFIQDVIREEAS